MHAKNRSADVPMIDVESIIDEEDKRALELTLAKDIRMQAEAVQLVRDASEKWLSQMLEQKRNDIEQLAIQFLLAMDSTLFLYCIPSDDCARTMEGLYGCYWC